MSYTKPVTFISLFSRILRQCKGHFNISPHDIGGHITHNYSRETKFYDVRENLKYNKGKLPKSSGVC